MKLRRILQRRGERGSSSVEMALLLPILLLATVGIIEFSRIVSARNMLSNAAREATRYASVRSVDSEDPVTVDMVRNHVLNAIGPLDPQLLTINTTWTPTNAPGNAVQVNLVYDFAPIAPIMPIALLELNASSPMIISY
jgi:Flp pilus assembly protein TadG